MASIEPFTHRKVVVLAENTTAQEAARTMCERAIGCIVVSNSAGEIVGILTDRDLTCTLLANSSDVDLPIGELMTPEPVLVDEGTPLEHVVRLMETHAIRRIPVIRHLKHGKVKCIGIVTLDDLITSRSVDEYHLIRIVKSQILQTVEYHHPYRTLKIVPQSEAVSDQEIFLKQFYRDLAFRAGLQYFNLNNESSREISQFILQAFVRRLHHTGALHFLSDFPPPVREKLLEMSTGPDRRVTVPYIISELEIRFNLSTRTACSILKSVCNSLEEILTEENLVHIKSQLPEDMRLLLSAS